MTIIPRHCLFAARTCSPVGVANVNIIPDSSMTASSSYKAEYGPEFGRLNHGDYGWSPKKDEDGEHLQIDLGAARDVCAVATQGGSSKEWVSKYKLAFSLDDDTWLFYQEAGHDKVCTVEQTVLRTSNSSRSS